MAHCEKVCTGHEHWAVQWPASLRARLGAGRWYDSGTGQSRAGLGAWPVAFDAGPSQTVLCSWVQFSGPTSWPAFGRVNASTCTLLLPAALRKAHSAGILVMQENVFEVFRPMRATCCTDWGKSWREGVGRLLHANFLMCILLQIFSTPSCETMCRKANMH